MPSELSVFLLNQFFLAIMPNENQTSLSLTFSDSQHEGKDRIKFKKEKISEKKISSFPLKLAKNFLSYSEKLLGLDYEAVLT